MYNYEEMKKEIFTETGFEKLNYIKGNATKLINLSGCAMVENIINGCGGDSWLMLACIDYLVEKNELTEIKYGKCCSQNRIFV